MVSLSPELPDTEFVRISSLILGDYGSVCGCPGGSGVDRI